VGVFVLRDKQVLLIKRAIEPYQGYWDIPGGFLEEGEHPEEGAVREIKEETGLVIEPTEILGVFMDEYGPDREATLNICYLAKVTGGEEKAGSDANEMAWFPLDNLPDQIAFNWSEEALERLASTVK
jgi:8-oxo-dGTP diphosphatase